MRIKTLTALATDAGAVPAGKTVEWDDADAARLIAAGCAEQEAGPMAALAMASPKPHPKRKDRGT